MENENGERKRKRKVEEPYREKGKKSKVKTTDNQKN